MSLKHSRTGKIAIIGGGIAGLTAAYLLREKFDITLFEKAERLGGNAYAITTPEGETADIATAAFGSSSYRNVLKLFRKLNIETVGAFRISPCRLSGPGAGFCDLDTKKGFFLTPGLRGLVAQNFEVLRPANVRNILQLMQGLTKGQELSRRGDLAGLTLEEALKKIPQFQGDVKLIFMGSLCLISSMHCSDVLDAPAVFFFDKLKKYNDLIPPKALFSVRFAKDGTNSYVRALSARYQDGIVLNAQIRTVRRLDGHVLVCMEDGKELFFDTIIFACNADQALDLLQEPTHEERRLLGVWRYTEGKVVVHTDHSLFPDRDLTDGYTFLYQVKGRYIETSVSGSLRSLPGISRSCDLISTQHPNFPIRRDRMLFEKVFRTPIFDRRSCPTIPLLPSLNGVKNTYYCGSHFGFGLHEDAVTSAIEVAGMLNVDF
ncbi:MAG TPA: FAD-dependent oxidoreductase [Nitrospirota bacterium]|nr:FAD-dependent oxidoreductase [Nitrospirota bacterium]